MSRPGPRPALQRAAHWAEYIAARILMAPLRVMPRKLAGRLAGWAGRVLVAGLPMTRRRIESGLAHAMPGLDRDARARIARDVGTHFGRVILEYFTLDMLAADPPPLTLSGPGLAALRTARAEGRGAVLVSGHFGNWEMIRLALLREGVPCAMIYRAFNNAPFDRGVRWRMETVGRPVMTKGRRGMRAFVTHVASGGVALVLVDQKQTGAPLVPFLGLPAETVPAAAELASRQGVPLIPAFASRAGAGFEVALEMPVPEGPPLARMKEVNDRISARIRAEPGQWFWLHDRWRARRRARPV